MFSSGLKGPLHRSSVSTDDLFSLCGLRIRKCCFWYILLSKVDTKSKVLIVLLVLVVVAVTAWKYDSFVTRHNFIVHDHIACDPDVESCFIYTCEEGDEECDDTPFKKIEKNAGNITTCPNYYAGNCPVLTCLEGEEDCAITLCNEETLEEGEECLLNIPEAYDDSTIDTSEDIEEIPSEEDTEDEDRL